MEFGLRLLQISPVRIDSAFRKRTEVGSPVKQEKVIRRVAPSVKEFEAREVLAFHDEK